MYSKKLLVTLCLLMAVPLLHAQEAPAPDARALLTGAMNHVKGLDSVSMNILMRQEMQFQGRESKAELNVSMILHGEKDLYAYVKGTGSEAEFFANADKQMVHLVSEKQYAERPATRQGLIGLIGGGVINVGAGWLGKYLAADASLLFMSTGVEYKGLEQPGGEGTPKQHHVTVKTQKYDADVWFLDGPAPLLQRLLLDFTRGVSGMAGAGKVSAEFVFSNWQPGISVPDSRFVFTPAADEKVLDLSAAAREPKDDLLGKAAPPIVLDLLDGGKLDLASHKGKNVVILDFFATWCGPCRMAMPVVAEVAKSYADKGVVFYTINSSEPPERIKPFLSALGLTVPVALDTNHAVATQYRVATIPHMVVVDKEGNVCAVHHGLSPTFKEEITGQLDAALAGKAPAPGK